MEYWSGYMDWPLDSDWRCEICGGRSMTWGFVHAQCRCNNCHTQYMMRDAKRQRVTVPISMLKPEYKAPAKSAWAALRIPVDELRDQDWETHGVCFEPD